MKLPVALIVMVAPSDAEATPGLSMPANPSPAWKSNFDGAASAVAALELNTSSVSPSTLVALDILLLAVRIGVPSLAVVSGMGRGFGFHRWHLQPSK